MSNRDQPPSNPRLFHFVYGDELIALPVFAENEPTAPVPPAPPPAAGGPMTPAQKEAPAATTPAAKPAIVMPAETTPSQPAPEKKEAAPREATAPASAANAKADKEKAPANKPAASTEENNAKPPEKTAARPKRPVHRPSVTKREREPRSNEPQTSPAYGAPDQRYERDYTETWRESEGSSYRAPPYYSPAPYGREEREMWREETAAIPLRTAAFLPRPAARLRSLPRPAAAALGLVVSSRDTTH